MTFDGYALVMQGQTGKLAGYGGSTFACDRLVLQGSRIQQQKAAQAVHFEGNIYSEGGVVRFSGPAGVDIKSAIHGSADLGFFRVGTDSSLIDGDTADHAETGRVILSGDNSDFTGRFLMGTLDVIIK